MNLSVKHPEFERCAKGSHTNRDHILFIFNRPRHHEPTAKQRADYERRKEMVRANGGVMARSLYDEAGTRRPFSKAEVSQCKRLVARTHKALKVCRALERRGLLQPDSGVPEALRRMNLSSESK